MDDINQQPHEVLDTNVVIDPLSIELKDSVFLETAITTRKEIKSKFAPIRKQIKENEKYFFGNQYNKTDEDTQDSETVNSDKFQDNIIHEAWKYVRSIARSRMPDVVVEAGNEASNEKIAENLSRLCTTDLKRRESRRTLSMAFSHLAYKRMGVIKALWNPEKGKHGDYEFIWVNPDNIDVDYRATSNDISKMDIVYEDIEHSVKEIVMRFPEKKSEFFDKLRDEKKFDENKNENNEAGLNTLVKYTEVWFTHYEKTTNDSTGESEYQRVECVAWYYGDSTTGLVFKKIKSPNWDWKGTQQTFKYEFKESGDGKYTREKVVPGEDELRQLLMGDQSMGMGLENEQIYHNHLEYPEKPYFIMGYEQYGDSPYDKTSFVEEVIPLQGDYDKRGEQITKLIDHAKVKHIFSSEAGMTAKDVEGMDMDNPKQSLVVKGKVGEVHDSFQGELPSVPLINDKAESRNRIFDKMGAKGVVRGDIETSVATTNQIARESGFTLIDDLVEDTINAAAEWMANWTLQFIKLRYTEDHFKRVLGPDGKGTWEKITRDHVEDGMEVSISASGVDKLKAEQRAMDMAQMQLIDPYTFYKDIGATDPETRTQRLLTFQLSPELYLQEILGRGDTASMATALNGSAPGGEPQSDMSSQATNDIMLFTQGQIPPLPPQVDEGYLNTFNAFMNSPDAEALITQNPEVGSALIAFAEQIVMMFEQMGQQAPAMPQEQPQTRFGQPVGQGDAGPISQNPQPGNTAKVNAMPPVIN